MIFIWDDLKQVGGKYQGKNNTGIKSGQILKLLSFVWFC